ncbi:MAG: RNA methyltransferase [Rhodobacterales bacterium]|nr:MAG: RNA methyltransferase [Rhodobacterales bacterium]
MSDLLDIFLVAPPGLEPVLADEAREAGFAGVSIVPGGVALQGDWREVWRANLTLRCAVRVLVRVAQFRAMHLAQLDKRARKVAWSDVLRPDVPVKVEATCRASRIYHAGAAAQRVERAIAETLGAPLSDEAPVTVKVRIDDDLCTLSVDSTGESLHKRGHKMFVGKAPMRESLAAAFLRQCGYQPGEPVLDPMCGSGTFVIEAAEMASGLLPGRSRAFAFEQLASFHGQAWRKLRRAEPVGSVEPMFYGSDRDSGAISGATANAERAGVSDLCQFRQGAVSDLERPAGPPGLVIVNPPYGARIGSRKPLFAAHDALGRRLMEAFSGWRVGIITSDAGLAKATGLPFATEEAPVPHGGLKVRLYRTDPLP